MFILLIGINFLNPIEKIKIHNNQFDEVSIIKINGIDFRDLNKNSLLDKYEDHRLDPITRAEDLLEKMTIEEKIGQMFHPPFVLEPDLLMLLYEIAIRGDQLTESQILFNHITHFNLYGNPDPEYLAKKLINFKSRISNEIRHLSISSDPIHEVPKGGGVASFSVDGFSKWPSQLGFAATNDPKIVEDFARIAKNEYLAVGIKDCPSPNV